MNKLRKVLVFALILFVILSSFTLYNDRREEKITYQTFKDIGIIKVLFVVAGITALIIVVLNFKSISNLFNHKEYVPEVVDADTALSTFLYAFLPLVGVPCHYVDGVIVPAQGVRYKFLDTRPRSDTLTGNQYLDFELWINSGEYQGLTTFTIRRDAGVEWIKKNIRFSVQHGRSLHTSVFEKRFPIDTPSSELMRLQKMRHEDFMEGADGEYLRSYDEQMKVVALSSKNGSSSKDTEEAPAVVVQQESSSDSEKEESPEEKYRKKQEEQL